MRPGKLAQERGYQLAELTEKYNELVRQHNRFRDARRSERVNASQKISELEGQVARLEMRLALAEQRATNAEARAESATQLASEIAKNMARTPEVLSESILTGLTTILQGYQHTAVEQPTETMPSMGDLGLDNNAGVLPGRFFPDVEFDGAPELWPTPGMMSSPSAPTMVPFTATGNGATNRPDGQQMFRAGEGGPPPVGGLE